MGFKSRFLYLAGLFSNALEETIIPSRQAGWNINSGIRHAFGKMYYEERMIELPFVFKCIRPPPASVLDIGCVESSLPVQLAMIDYNVTGIDIRDYCYRHMNLQFIKQDFISYKFDRAFDCVTAISTIEHLGLKSYGQAKQDINADKKAVQKIASLLKPKGQFIFTAPYGLHDTIGTFERIYDENDIKNLFKHFKIQSKEFYKVVDRKAIKKVSQENLERLKHGETNSYGVILVNAIKK